MMRTIPSTAVVLGLLLAARSVSAQGVGGRICDATPGCATPHSAPLSSGREGAFDPGALDSGALGPSDQGAADGVYGDGFTGDGFTAESFLGRVNQLAGASGSRGEYGALGSNSIGDFLSLPSYVFAFDGLAVRSEIPGGQRIKAVENNSPLPQDRVFFTYNHFHNAFRSESNFNFFSGELDVPLDNYTAGIEKTFHDGLWSLDLRVPGHGSVTYDFGNFYLNQTNNMGDVYLAVKVLLRYWQTGALCAGVGITFPTGSDIEGFVNSTAYKIDHRSLHLAPYLGYVASPCDRVYLRLWGQLDFDATGNRYRVEPFFGPTQVGVVQDTPAGYASASLAWNFIENRRGALRSLGAVFELHYSGTLGHEDAYTANDFPSSLLRFGAFDIDGDVFANDNTLSLLNMTAGFQYEFANGLNGRIGAVTPLTSGREALFPFELVVQTDLRF